MQWFEPGRPLFWRWIFVGLPHNQWTVLIPFAAKMMSEHWAGFSRWSGLITKIIYTWPLCHLTRFLCCNWAGNSSTRRVATSTPEKHTIKTMKYSMGRTLPSFPCRILSILKMSFYFWFFPMCVLYVAGHWFKLKSRSLYGVWASVVILIPVCLRTNVLGYE